MARINEYETDSSPSMSDKVIGTEVGLENDTKNYTIQSIADLIVDAGVLKLIAPNGTVYLLKVDDAGALSTEVA